MDWVPIFFVFFKVIVFGTGMFLAIKWHYDQDKKKNKGGMMRLFMKVAAIFVRSLLGLMFATVTLANLLNLDMAYP